MSVDLQRGDIVICVLAGDYGKPRPAVIAQANLFNPTHASIVVCPITSYLIDASLFRLELIPNESNGLTAISQIMVDKLTAIKADKISKKIGELSKPEIEKLNNALRLWLEI